MAIDTDKKNAIADYIRKYRAQGFSDEALRGFLLKRGYEKDLVDAAFRSASGPAKLIVVALIIAALAVITAIIIAVLPVAERDCGTDLSCFTIAANECAASRATQNLGRTVFLYTTQQCVLSKQILSFDENEPKEVVDLFSGKVMFCPYDEGTFDTVWLTGLTAGLEECEGPLVDAIYDLRLAQAKLRG